MKCKKCDSIGTLAIRKEYFFCDDCFLSYVNHKFRACIGKNTKIKPKDKALLCLSGGSSSIVLLDLVMNSVSLETHKKLRITPVLLHITGLKNDSLNQRNSQLLHDLSKKYNTVINEVNINDYKWKNTVDLNFCTKFLGLTHNPTAKLDYEAKIKQNLYYEVAKEMECNLIFTGETNTTLAQNLLSNIVMGRGSQVENDIGFCDGRNCNVKLLRPMRDLSVEELDHYKRIKKLDSVCDTNISVNSIQKVISNFVDELQTNSPATISTICKTADKLGTAAKDIKESQICSLCQSNLDVHNSKLTAIEAISFSKRISSGDISKAIKICSNELDNVESSNFLFPDYNITLCYCCSKTYSELNNTSV
ncbi:unnamed protein product [Leptidea sinapis]|uniref:Cytoplasmic tRNA 2-thiolation protein 2 n=1 Tax=Leptidea sinapis TaxID=189913 RepID=A0A5E4PNU9_9NEOP|nr:unnamed protein product [Leptidea sinapis]